MRSTTKELKILTKKSSFYPWNEDLCGKRRSVDNSVDNSTIPVDNLGDICCYLMAVFIYEIQ